MKKLKEATGKAGFVFPTANNNGGWQFTHIAWSYGVNFMEQDKDGKWKATFNTPECAEALQYIKDLKWKYDVLPMNTFIDHTELFKTYATGNASMVIGSGSDTGSFVPYEMAPETIGALATPKGPKGWASLLGGTVTNIKADVPEQIDGALKWFKTSTRPDATDEYKTNAEQTMQTRVEKGELVTVKKMSIWNESSSALQFTNDLINKYANANVAHVKPYNDFISNPGDCTIHPEEPVCCQELYGILDNCIQEVLTNKDADPATLLEKANSDFQQNYLDNL